MHICSCSCAPGAYDRTVRTARPTPARSVARWHQNRCLARSIGRLCDRLFDRTSMQKGKYYYYVS